MFLSHLHEDKQKKLFLQLATVVMMAEGHSSTASSLIDEKIENLNDDHTLIFWQSLKDSELLALGICAFECGYVHIDPKQIGDTEHTKQLILDKIKNSNLSDILAEEVTAVLSTYGKDEATKKKVLDNLINNDVNLVDIDADSMKSEFLKLPELKKEALENTAQVLIEDSNILFSEKNKKIILFELIGAGFSDGYFDQSEEHLIHKICHWLNIEKEYVNEFLELSTSMFTLCNDISDLINE